jgi:indolepyruvate ferredoxin oxidoreductase
MPGVAALVRMLVDQMRLDRRAGLNTAAFVSGYPGSPLGGIDRELLRQNALLQDLEIVHQPGLNEELAATAVFGSQAATVAPGFARDGVLGIWYGKAPGLDRAADAIRHGNYAGTGPLSGALVLVGDDPACKSSTLPSSSEGLCADLSLPILHPGDVQEVLDLGHHAVALSRYSGLWAAVKMVTVVADGTGSVDLDLDRIRCQAPALGDAHRVVSTLHQPFTGQLEREIQETRLPRAREYGVLNGLNLVTVDAPDAWLGIVAGGHTYVDVIEALRLLGLSEQDAHGLGVRILKVRMPYPLDRAEIRRFAAGLTNVLVIEERRPFIEPQIRSALYGLSNAPVVEGKDDDAGSPLIPSWGVLDAGRILPFLRSRLERRVDAARLAPEIVPQRARQLLPLATPRPAWFCSGCPHATSTRAPGGALVGTGIGCHAIASRMEPSRTGTVLSNTQMGGEGAQWVGAAPFLADDHLFQNIGDGTLAHSGWLSIRFAVAANSHITFKLLYNAAIAMTGGQNALGLRSIPDIVRGLRAEGVGRIIVTSDEPKKYRRIRLARGVEVWDRTRILEAQVALAVEPGVTVLIHDQECAAELRRKRNRGIVPVPTHRVVVNQRVCEACGDCGVKSACLSLHSVDTPFGPKTTVDQSSCNFDHSCIEGDCPSFMLVEKARPSRFRRRSAGSSPTARRSEPIGDVDLPEPIRQAFGDVFSIRMPGIGGTGVVTVAQILGLAATLDGLAVHGLDQTGLSQKAGAVVSDLRVSRTDDPRPGKSSAEPIDLFLVLDALVGLSPDLVAGLAAGRTTIVGSRSWTPTGPMIGNPYAEALDSAAAEQALGRLVDRSIWVDAAVLAQNMVGKTTGSNILLVGVAYQSGALPMTAESIQNAIRQNGVAVDANLAAFRAGRRVIADPQVPVDAAPVARAVPPALADRVAAIGDVPLRELVTHRAIDLVGYQSVKYAGHYVDAVLRATSADDSAFARAVAVNLYKLMAYKDEYEVARLCLTDEATDQAESVAGPGARRTILLHPPALRALGLRRKLRVGPSAQPVLRVLATGKRLRGTPLDPFGATRIRRLERHLVAEYRDTIERLIRDFASIESATAVEIAELPGLIRGYEHVKLASVGRYRDRLAGLTRELDRSSR